ncbi:uncharacterized protein N7484_004402 [Penicillium longicatenatum]|uniref:uncharacterized protein n=1 Tax=Penicillium longicatenatum TaxID=1561947 RepID=UPI002548C362|nr:uncharacterized protein N7484_004402 [Penicillium longicatenatum]KAJ5650679.1 hypothetical protein N7484_004402 [Penicillium longicatenatum]
MRIAFSSSLLAFAATAAGLRILSPAIDQKVEQDDTITVRWEAVSTDPPKMDIYLVNQNAYPNTQEVIATGVDTSLGKYTIKAKDVGDVDTGGGYQVNFVSTTGGGILAQSQQFKVTPSKAEASSSGKMTSTASESLSTSASISAFFYCFFERYSHLHQCVYLCHFSFIYCFTYFYFCPYLICYDEFYQCVHPCCVFQFFLKKHNPFKHCVSHKLFALFHDSLLYISPFLFHVVHNVDFHKDALFYYVLLFCVFHKDPIFFYVIVLFLSHSFFVSHPSSSTTASMETSTTTKHEKTATSTESASATSTSNAAGYLMPPTQAGGLLLGLFALAL